MALFLPPYRHLPDPEPPALVRVVTRGEMQWNRPMFKAPPLEVKIPVFDSKPFFMASPKIERAAGR